MNLSAKFRFLMLLFCLLMGGLAYSSYIETREHDALRNTLDAKGIRTTAKVVKVTWTNDSFGIGNPKAEITYQTTDLQTINTQVEISSDEKDVLVANPNLSTIDIRYSSDAPNRATWVGDVAGSDLFPIPIFAGLASIVCLLIASIPRRFLQVPGMFEKNPQGATGRGTNLQAAPKRGRARIYLSALLSLIILLMGVFLWRQNNSLNIAFATDGRSAQGTITHLSWVAKDNSSSVNYTATIRFETEAKQMISTNIHLPFDLGQSIRGSGQPKQIPIMYLASRPGQAKAEADEERPEMGILIAFFVIATGSFLYLSRIFRRS